MSFVSPRRANAIKRPASPKRERGPFNDDLFGYRLANQRRIAAYI